MLDEPFAGVDPIAVEMCIRDRYCISAISGSGTGDLMDLIVSKFKKESDEILDEEDVYKRQVECNGIRALDWETYKSIR